MRIRDALRFGLARNDDFYAFLIRQAQVAHEGAIALATLPAAEAGDAFRELELEGDRVMHQMEESLARTFVTPIDREDLQRLSADLDAVLDVTNGAVRAVAMFGVEHPTGCLKKLCDVLVRAAAKLQDGVARLRDHQYSELIADVRELRAIDDEGDDVYADALAILFRDTPSTAYRDGVGDPRVVIREKAVLDELKNAIDRCASVGESLAHLAVKHA